MELQTISQVAKAYDISARMLRYYEQAGLIRSLRNENNAYRLYDETAIQRVQQITTLRKLQIPVKQICLIMNNPGAAAVIEIFKRSLAELDTEITALSTIKSILDRFIKELERIAGLSLNLDFLGDASVLKMTGALSMTQRNLKDAVNMNDLNKAAHVLNKLRGVRIVFLPPMTVAAAFYTGDGAYEKAWRAVDEFVRRDHLLEIKPDLRVFRIEHSNATGQSFGSEVWVSIPNQYTLPDPLTQKIFLGGQYAAHTLGDDGLLTYLGLQDWINESERYQYDYDGNLTRVLPPIREVNSLGGVRLDPEEVLNYRNCCRAEPPGTGNQIDVLFPVKDYCPSEGMPAEIPGSQEKCGFKASIVTKNKFKILGFTQIVHSESGGKDCRKGADGRCVGCGRCGSTADRFAFDIQTDGRLELLNQYRKPGSPLLGFSSHDMDSQMRGGWRSTFCLMESDLTDMQAFMESQPYIRTIDAAKWLIFEYTRGDTFDDHRICSELGYTWNGTISGSFMVYPDGKIGKPISGSGEAQRGVLYCWYPVK